MTIYTETVFLPRYGVEITLTRAHGQRWWVVGDVDLEGNARQRAHKPKPRGSVPVTAWARAETPYTWREPRRTPSTAHRRARQHE